MHRVIISILLDDTIIDAITQESNNILKLYPVNCLV